MAYVQPSVTEKELRHGLNCISLVRPVKLVEDGLAIFEVPANLLEESVDMLGTGGSVGCGYVAFDGSAKRLV